MSSLQVKYNSRWIQGIVVVSLSELPSQQWYTVKSLYILEESQSEGVSLACIEEHLPQGIKHWS